MMTALHRRLRARYDRWFAETWPRLGPLVMLVCIAVSTFAAVGVLVLTKVQGDEQQRRSQAIIGLQQCFDTYAKRSSQTSQAVREASVQLADATTARDIALDGLFNYIATEPRDENPEGGRLFTVLLATNADLVASQANLSNVRRDNPVPDPPSTFCDVSP